LITGGTSGIGFALGKALIQLDNEVILLGRNRERLDETKKLGFHVIACDLSKQEEIENAAVEIQNRFSRLHILFNNAGVQFNYDFLGSVMPLNKIDTEMNINLTGQVMLTQLLLPLLSSSGDSFIVNTTSGLGAFPKDDGLVYSASKAAMRNFTTGLRYRLKNTSIGVLELIPPVTDTGMTKARAEDKMPATELVRKILPQLRRERRMITVAKMRLFLIVSVLFPSLAHKISSKP
jgi:uncharacterized oxidoreductase